MALEVAAAEMAFLLHVADERLDGDVGALDLSSGEALGVLDGGPQRMTVVGIARQRLGMQHELASRSAGVSGDDRDLDAELVGRASLALADALDLILDDFSRYIIAWKLCSTMKAEDVAETLELALKALGCESAKVAQRPRLLSDNGSSYIAGDLAEWLGDRGIRHIRGAPFHPQTQGKIERWHQTLKNRILLENYYLPGDLEA
jgi:hypothetical protein